MKSNFVYLSLIIAILLVSCKDQNDQRLKQNKNSETINNSVNQICFQYSNNKDTIFLSYTHENDSITEGNLIYSFFEKDRNVGTFKGKWKGDSLFADYEFKSEGTVSIREVFFYKTNSGLVEGYGPVKDTLNKVVFQEHSTLVLNENIFLEPVKCD